MLNIAHQTDEVLLADIANKHNESNDERFGIWWLGQSGFLIKWQGYSMIFDPYLSDSLTKKYAETDKPHVRITEQVVAPERLQGIVAVTSSHIHTDHLDAETLIPLKKANPDLKLVLPEANIDFATDRLHENPPEMLGLDAGTVVEVGPFTFTGVAAAHNTIEKDDAGRCRFIGFVVSFGPWTVYHSGDTLWHDGLVNALLPHQPQLLMLPINGNKPERRVAGNLNGTEAAALAKAVGARAVIPCHYDMFTFNTDSPKEFETVCESLQQPCHVLANGQGLDFEGLS